MADGDDPDEDIDTNPSKYINRKGAAVRIRAVWTRSIFGQSAVNNSFQLIRTANALLRKYTLSLDVHPVGTAALSAHLHAHKQIHDALEAQRKTMTRVRAKFFRDLQPATEAFRNFVADEELDRNDMVSKALISFDGTMQAHEGATPPIEQFQTLRNLIEPVTEPNRLIVVFVSMNGSNGYTALFQPWLPWVLVDPQSSSDPNILIHEIGHACRLAHQQVEGTATAKVPKHRNIMSYAPGRDQLWGWQVELIYNSYWCEGVRPKTWWDTQSQAILPVDHPFLWGEN